MQMDVNTKLLPNQGEFLKDAERYRRLVKKLNYLMMIRLDITFAVSMVNQFFVNIKDYSPGSVNEDFEISEESSRKRTFLFRLWTHSSSRFLRYALGRMLF